MLRAEWHDNAAYLTEEEKTELLGLLIGRVTLTERTEAGITAPVSLLLSGEGEGQPIGEANIAFASKLQTPRSIVEDLRVMGAGDRLELPTFGL